MTDRVCAECGASIPDKPQVLFCDKQCTLSYMHENGGVPKEPVTA